MIAMTATLACTGSQTVASNSPAHGFIQVKRHKSESCCFAVIGNFASPNTDCVRKKHTMGFSSTRKDEV